MSDKNTDTDDHRRPGLRARKVQDIARDLMLARDYENSSQEIQLDVGESSGRRGRAIFLLGAGCSFSAGIPLASEVAKQCACLLDQRYNFANQNQANLKQKGTNLEKLSNIALKNLISRGEVPSNFLLSDQEGDWGELYKYFFSEHFKSPNHQREIISRIIADHEYSLNWAHACLGELVHKRYIHTVLTTNFDQLVLQGIIRTGITPVVADGLESLARIDPSPARPQVVHLHGSMHTYDLRNSVTALTETENDRNLQSMMMSLLKQSTILVVVGYAGGEEGVMSLLQYAATNIPRLVVYWIANEKSYNDLSVRAKTLLETGDNKFFIPEQDADSFFQRLMKELGLGQPDWVANPIGALQHQSHQFEGGSNDEITELVRRYNERVNYADRHRLKGDEDLVRALQARSAGEFDNAIRALKHKADRDQRKLYAQCLRDSFDLDPERNAGRIDEAIEEFENLLRTGRPPSFSDANALIEALFDRLSNRPDAAPDEDQERMLGQIDEIISAARDRLKAGEHREHALLNFHQARATQERSEKSGVGRDVIHGYERAVRNPNALGDKIDEARDGLAQALIQLTEAKIKKTASISSAARRTMQNDVQRAITVHTELVDLAYLNRSNDTFAGTLRNLAYDYEILAKIEKQPAEKQNALRKAISALERAMAAHQLDGDADNFADSEARLVELRQKL